MENIEGPEESEIKIDYVKIIKDALLFYTTAFFVLLLICRYRTINNSYAIQLHVIQKFFKLCVFLLSGAICNRYVFLLLLYQNC